MRAPPGHPHVPARNAKSDASHHHACSSFSANVAPKAPAALRSAPVKAFEFNTDSKPWTGGEISDKAGMVALAEKLNPAIGFWGAPHAPRAAYTRRKAPRAIRCG